jgi:hypothetical protein
MAKSRKYGLETTNGDKSFTEESIDEMRRG